MFDIRTSLFGSPQRVRRVYTWSVQGSYVVAIAALLAGIALGLELAGTAVYAAGVWLGLGLSVVIPRVSSVTLQDERDLEQFHRASGLVMSLLVFVGLAIVPAAYVLDAAGEITIGARGWGAIYLYGAIGLLWGACYVVVRYWD
ncbi:hypothetical protein GCM10028857_08770 [Salinarchaeum chitinilyticum]